MNNNDPFFLEPKQTFTTRGDKKVLMAVIMAVALNIGAYIGTTVASGLEVSIGSFSAAFSIPLTIAGLVMGVLWSMQKYTVTSEAVTLNIFFMPKTFSFSEYVFARRKLTGIVAYLQTLQSPGDILVLKRGGRRSKRFFSLMPPETFEAMWQAIKQKGGKMEEHSS